MNIDEILHECVITSSLGKVPISTKLVCAWEKENENGLKPDTLCFMMGTKYGPYMVSREARTKELRQQILKEEQDIDRKRAQLGRERFQEFKADGLNPTISAALACLAEQIGMEKIKEAMAQAELQVKGKK